MTIQEAYEILGKVRNDCLTGNEFEAIFWLGQYLKLGIRPYSFLFKSIHDVIDYLNHRHLVGKKIEFKNLSIVENF